MRTSILIQTMTAVLVSAASANVIAGYEIVCKGQQASPQHKTVWVDCNNRKQVVDTLGAAWRTLRQQGIGGHAEDMCWESFNDARHAFARSVCGPCSDIH